MTGGGGFLGRAVVERLLARGVEVTSFARGAHPALAARGVRILRGDLGDAEAVSEAIRGQDIVFHVAAKAGVWGPRAEYERANVEGTEHVIAGVLRHGVRVLVHTSSPSVVFDGTSHRQAGPDLAYPTRHLAVYSETKARAEQLVLAAHGSPLERRARGANMATAPLATAPLATASLATASLATVALRPHLVFGPGDPHLVPRLIERADRGQLRIVGDGENEVSLTYVDNAADAHLAAADALWSGGASAEQTGGRAFFVSNREPVRLWDWVNGLLTATGRAPITRRVPASVAYGAGAVLESLHRVLRRPGEPRMTRFVARQLSTSHTYDLAPFEDATGYRETVPMPEATARTIAWLTGASE